MGRRRLRTVSADELAHSRAHFLEAIRDDGAVCLECGGVFRALPYHVWWHGGTSAEYRAKWGYSPSNSLMIPPLVEKLRERALARNFAASAPPGALERARAVLRERRPRQSREARLAKAEITRARRASGWRPHEKRRKVDDVTLRGLVEEGLTIGQIAARTGVWYGTAWRHIRRLGLVSPAIAPRGPTVSTAELLALCRAGFAVKEIAARTGLAVGALKDRFRRLRRRGVLVPDESRARREAITKEILALARGGLKGWQIAARLGLTARTVWYRLRALRARGLAPPGPRQVTDEEVLALARAGMRPREIGRRVGLTHAGVLARLRALRRRGLAVPPPSGPLPNARRRVSDEELIPLARAGLGVGEIAARVALAPNSVGDRIRRLRRRGLLPPDEALARRAALTAELLALRRAGLPTEEIAARTGLAAKAVRDRLRWVRRCGAAVPPPPTRTRVSDEQVLALCRAGLSTQQIAARTRMTPHAVSARVRLLRRRGLVPEGISAPAAPARKRA